VVETQVGITQSKNQGSPCHGQLYESYIPSNSSSREMIKGREAFCEQEWRFESCACGNAEGKVCRNC